MVASGSVVLTWNQRCVDNCDLSPDGLALPLPRSSRDALHCAGRAPRRLPVRAKQEAGTGASLPAGSSGAFCCSSSSPGSSASVSNRLLRCASTAKRGFTDPFPGIGCYFGPIKVQLLSPDESGFLALFDNRVERSDERPQDHSGCGSSSGWNDRAAVRSSHTQDTSSR